MFCASREVTVTCHTSRRFSSSVTVCDLLWTWPVLLCRFTSHFTGCQSIKKKGEKKKEKGLESNYSTAVQLLYCYSMTQFCLQWMVTRLHFTDKDMQFQDVWGGVINGNRWYFHFLSRLQKVRERIECTNAFWVIMESQNGTITRIGT